MKQARLPLNPAALKAANAAVHGKTVPPGRPLHPTDPADRELRQAWLESYEAAGGAMVTPSRRPATAKASCPVKDNNFIELKYKHCEDSPVAGAKFHIRSPSYSADGTLDRNGFVRIDGVSQIGSFEFWFDKDPEVYRPKPPKPPTIEAKQAAQAEADGILDWLWGTIQGNFNQDPTTSQIAVNMVLGVIPVVDQVLDVRDLIGGVKHLCVYYCESEEEQKKHQPSLGLSYEAWLWLDFFITAIGCIPELGSVVKGVLNTIIINLKRLAKTAGGMSLQERRRLWLQVIEVMNDLALVQGNSHTWLKQLPGKLDGLIAQAATKIRTAIKAVDGILANAEVKCSSWIARQVLDDADGMVAKVRRARAGLLKAEQRLNQMRAEVTAWLKRQVSEVIEGAHPQVSSGGINAKAADGANTVKQGRQEALELASRVDFNDVLPGFDKVRVKRGDPKKIAIIGRSMGKGVEPYEKALRAKYGDDVHIEIFKADHLTDAEAKQFDAAWKEFEKAAAKRKLTHPNDPYLPDSEVEKSAMYQANKAWAEKLEREGYTVIDIGEPPLGPGDKPFTKSPFYEMEKGTISGLQ